MRDDPGVKVTDTRVKWEKLYDNEADALYSFEVKGVVVVSLKWDWLQGYTVSLRIGGDERVIHSFKDCQHIDCAKSYAVDAAFEFFCEGAEEIDKAELEYRYRGE